MDIEKCSINCRNMHFEGGRSYKEKQIKHLAIKTLTCFAILIQWCNQNVSSFEDYHIYNLIKYQNNRANE